MVLKQITAKFNSTCSESGKRIKKGESCLYDYNARKVYSLCSKMAEKNEKNEQALKENNFDEMMIDLGANY